MLLEITLTVPFISFEKTFNLRTIQCFNNRDIFLINKTNNVFEDVFYSSRHIDLSKPHGLNENPHGLNENLHGLNENYMV